MYRHMYVESNCCYEYYEKYLKMFVFNLKPIFSYICIIRSYGLFNHKIGILLHSFYVQ